MKLQFKNIKALLLAAGMGTRLKPLTSLMPKPLIPLCGQSMLDIILSRLSNAGISETAVNSHYMHEKISEHIESGPFRDVTRVYYEPEILGTGGPLVNASGFLSDSDCFMIHNADILSDFDLKAALDFHLTKGGSATMILIDGPENKVAFDEKTNDVTDILDRLGPGKDCRRKLTYTGIMVLSKDIFSYLPPKPEFCSVIDALLKMLKHNPGCIGAFLPEKAYWNDLGTLPQYFSAHEDILLKGKLKLENISGNIHHHITAQISEGAHISGFLSAGPGSRVESGAVLKNCILMEDASIQRNEYRCNEIIGPGFSVNRDFHILKELNILKDADKAQISTLAERGSDRRFYRIKHRASSKVLMLSSASDNDFERFLKTGSFLNSAGIPVPEIYEHDSSEYAVLMEDLGDISLFDWVKDRERAEVLEMYVKIAECLAYFHRDATAALENSSEAPPVRDFDYDYLRWETSYFRENFLENHLKIPPEKTSRLDETFHALALEVLKQPQVLMHRDFQSQNIMLKDGKPRFIDFQGARIGPMAYDIMSLAKDPYVELDDDLQRNILDSYFDIAEKTIPGLNSENFEKYCVCAGLQRLMQALGAYAFLGLKKGKIDYLEHIPAGTRALTKLLSRKEILEKSKLDFSFLEDVLRT